MSSFSDDITVAAASALVRRKSFAEATGVSDAERRYEQSQIRKAAEPAAAERVSLRFGKVIEAFKDAEGRSPDADDREVWKALSAIVKEEVGARAPSPNSTPSCKPRSRTPTADSPPRSRPSRTSGS